MKYLKKYKIFESDSIPQDMVEDIRDILADLEDGGRIKTSISTEEDSVAAGVGKNKKYIAFYLSDHMDYDGFLFEEISYYVFRLKRYLSEDFKNCSAIFVGKSLTFFNRANIDLNNEEELIKKLKDKPMKNLIIEIK